ncbi:MAG: hydroxyacylglutathione hydrolase [Deltaproteobacteria bacterium]|nr:hydroxyacylglutathione hydrolase [Deltaproteobacteria bacterium]
MRIVPVPQLRDNYAYLVIEETTGEALVIDAAEADVIRAACAREHAQLKAVLSTHYHPDHTGGNAELAAMIPGLRVIGSVGDRDRTPALTEALADRAQVQVGALRAEVLSVPCHTRGHVAYRFGRDLFSGDTLFIGGCGRFFEGGPREMYHALYQVIGTLPDDTRVWCGHEYTEKNLDFALSVEPLNQALRAKRAEAAERRARGEPTVPSTLGAERSHNPFLRVTSPEISATIARRAPATDLSDPIAVLGALRALKDQF